MVQLLLTFSILLSFSYMVIKIYKVSRLHNLNLDNQNICTIAQTQKRYGDVLIPLLIAGFLIVPLTNIYISEFDVDYIRYMSQIMLWTIVALGAILLGLSVFFNGSKAHTISGYIMVIAYLFASLSLTYNYLHFNLVYFLSLLAIIIFTFTTFLILMMRRRFHVDFRTQAFLIIMFNVYICLLLVYDIIDNAGKSVYPY